MAINKVFFVFKILNFFGEYIMMENSNYKNENIERKYLNNMRKNQFLKVRYSLLELEKDFIELKDRELKDREEKFKREMEELFLSQLLCLQMILISLNKNYEENKAY